MHRFERSRLSFFCPVSLGEMTLLLSSSSPSTCPLDCAPSQLMIPTPLFFSTIFSPSTLPLLRSQIIYLLPYLKVCSRGAIFRRTLRGPDMTSLCAQRCVRLQQWGGQHPQNKWRRPKEPRPPGAGTYGSYSYYYYCY